MHREPGRVSLSPSWVVRIQGLVGRLCEAGEALVDKQVTVAIEMLTDLNMTTINSLLAGRDAHGSQDDNHLELVGRLRVAEEPTPTRRMKLRTVWGGCSTLKSSGR